MCSSIEEYELDASSQSWNDVIQDSPNFGFVFEGYYTDRWDGTYQTYIGITQDNVYAFPLFNDDAYPVLPEDPIVSDGIYWTCLDMSFDI